MNQIFRPDDAVTLQPGEILRAGHEDWNNRINRAIAGETAWKRTAWLAMALFAGSAALNVWQGRESKLVDTVHIVHDAIGNVINVHPEMGENGKPSSAQIAAALRQWVVNVRTVGVDIPGMRRAILDAFKLVPLNTQAFTLLSQFFNGDDPFKRAAAETVNVSDLLAIPPPPATLGKDDLQTWQVRWTETVTGRDGTIHSISAHAATVTFTVVLPKTRDEAMDDPNGIHFLSFAWTQQ